LDEERREAFLQALQSLQEEQNEAERREREEQRYQEEMLKRDIEDQRRKREQEDRERKLLDEKRQGKKSSEVDYGVEDSPSSASSAIDRAARAASANGAKTIPDSTPVPRPSKPQPPARKAPKVEPTLVARAGNIIGNMRKLLEDMTGNVTGSPLNLMRTIGFILFFLAVFGRAQVRERIRRVAGQGWAKILQTAGMGVKVSYI
jgi:hypothetical protein